MSLENDKCWDNIINNANCICAWFWRESEFESGRCWDDAVNYDCDKMFWGGMFWDETFWDEMFWGGLKKGNCNIYESDQSCLTGCGSCNVLRWSWCKD